MINYSTGWSALLEPGQRIIESHEHAYRFPITLGLSMGVLQQASFPRKKLAPVLWGNVPVSRPLQLRHGHSSISEQLGMELAVPKPCRKSVLHRAKTVQDTMRSLKAIWHFVKFNSIPHILPALSNFVVLWIWHLFLVYPYKTAFKEKCAQAKPVSSLPVVMGMFSISFAFLYESFPSHLKQPFRTFCP